MSDDYIWNGTGPPDPTTKRLEGVLGTLRYQTSPLTIPTPAPSRVWRSLALAAVIAFVGIGLWLSLPPDEVAPKGGLVVTTLAGAPSIGEKALKKNQGHLAQGQWLETDTSSRAKLTLPEIGQVEVSPNSKVRLVNLDKDQQRLELNRGRIDAFVVAPPRLFVVDTPSAKAVDLGCAYSLEVNEKGDSLLSVTSGYVSLEGNGRSSLVPAGASCKTCVGLGPGTPYFTDTVKIFQDALYRLDFEKGGEEEIKTLISLSQPKDSLTLWHLLPRVDEPLRKDLYAALSQIAPLPDGVTEEDILRLDRAALEAWKNGFSEYW